LLAANFFWPSWVGGKFFPGCTPPYIRLLQITNMSDFFLTFWYPIIRVYQRKSLKNGLKKMSYFAIFLANLIILSFGPHKQFFGPYWNSFCHQRIDSCLSTKKSFNVFLPQKSLLLFFHTKKSFSFPFWIIFFYFVMKKQQFRSVSRNACLRGGDFKVLRKYFFK